MSRRREIEIHLRRLGEIREIMSSMKTLAYIETRKLAHRLENQSRIVSGIEEAARDFLSFHPYTLARSTGLTELYLAIGTERGFCGDLNERVHGHLETELGPVHGSSPMIMAVGRRLWMRLGEDARVVAALEGADTVEEADRLVAEIIGKAEELCGGTGNVKLVALYERSERSEITVEPVLPPFLDLADTRPVHPEPPLLNLEPADFLVGLVDQYLLAMVQEIVYAALMDENQRRIHHLDGAVRHLDDRIAGLERRRDRVRQEEIIEEIEVILLGAAEK